MKVICLTFLGCCLALTGYAQLNGSSKQLLNPKLVNLKGSETVTVFINSTADSVKLNYAYFDWLPYTETKGTLKLAPGKSDTLKLKLSFPGFIHLNSRYAIYNIPGGSLICDIKSYTAKAVNLAFGGDIADINSYYMAYEKYLGSFDQESRPYYDVSEQLTNWDLFPAKADSITRIRLKYLNQYTGDLPDWFKKHEHQRLKFNEYFRLANALASKEFYSSKKIPVSPAYYQYEQQFSQTVDMILNESYLNLGGFYFSRQNRFVTKANQDNFMLTIDSLYPQTDLGDVFKMYRMGGLYRSDRMMYDSILSSIAFKQPERKHWMDSLIQSRLGNPYIGKKAPKMSLTDTKGKTVLLDDFAGNILIVNFWATWCGACMLEFPHENRLYQQYKGKGLVVVNICVDSDREQWGRVSQKHNLQMINLYTSKADYNNLSKLYNLGSLPRTLVIDRQGKVANNYFKKSSSITDTDIQQLLK